MLIWWMFRYLQTKIPRRCISKTKIKSALVCFMQTEYFNICIIAIKTNSMLLWCKMTRGVIWDLVLKQSLWIMYYLKRGGCFCHVSVLQGVFDQRMKTWAKWQDAQMMLQRKREAEAKLQYANKPDKLQQAKDEIKEVQNTTHS